MSRIVALFIAVAALGSIGAGVTAATADVTAQVTTVADGAGWGVVNPGPTLPQAPAAHTDSDGAAWG
ncbi:hypothetical protein Lfu02_47580 [Longispora fulva]|uniref:Uncharacterized protein n=1 Tax=Longispora fulva TaxID=619741 RepID=A0A8J7GTL2_9ACTN|nr:hypothetical protein [Longispora fulva]MBG6138133.1 hypothetical protein [Longispora fulva]GIG60386.1 hypothetical protein Lfu02_47580 [Longispora fulva]